MAESVADVDDRAAELRDELVRSLRDDDTITSPAVEAAFRSVPRHTFAPGVALEHAYARHAVITKHDGRGRPTSSVSDPHIQAVMLEQAGVEPGMRVLEIGSGGYNAALLAELVGVEGRVTTVDIDADVTARAREFLDATGYERVEVVTADAEEGVPGRAPYDRIVVTVGTWDVPPAWATQLAPGGRMVVPLRTRGVTRSVVFEVDGDHLVSRGSAPCGFVAMQGVGEHRERRVPLGEAWHCWSTTAVGTTPASRTTFAPGSARPRGRARRSAGARRSTTCSCGSPPNSPASCACGSTKPKRTSTPWRRARRCSPSPPRTRTHSRTWSCARPRARTAWS
ncbi:methyltransferase, FxLD system [Streptomyces sp. SID3343]|uniref:methyltransferase, FxLD system n=1 Tax=Streptomyces sp. SID3343 TaxID=2690260 RepID=UPI0031F988DF